jgi:DNA-binding GntR family transcriptional regulator
MINPGENVTLTDEAYSKIKQMMFQHKIMPSQKLIYKDLAELLSMSQTPIINALNRLEEQGFLVSTAFRGFYVKPIDIDELMEQFAIREALESHIVEQVIKKASDKDLKNLKEKMRLHAEYKPDHYDNKKLVVDADVHIQMATINGNNAMTKILAMAFEHIILRYPPESRNPLRLITAIEEHQKLFKLISSRNVPENVEFIKSHIRNGRDFLVKSMSEEKQRDTIEYFEIKM